MKAGVQIPGCTHQASHTHLRPQSRGQEEKGGLLELSGLQSSSGTVKSKFRKRCRLKEITEYEKGYRMPLLASPGAYACTSVLTWGEQAHMHQYTDKETCLLKIYFKAFTKVTNDLFLFYLSLLAGKRTHRWSTMHPQECVGAGITRSWKFPRPPTASGAVTVTAQLFTPERCVCYACRVMARALPTRAEQRDITRSPLPFTWMRHPPAQPLHCLCIR